MKKFILLSFYGFLLSLLGQSAFGQKLPTVSAPKQRCSTMEELKKAIEKDPTLPEKWAAEGKRQWAAYQQRQQQTGGLLREQAGEIVIPIVFHLVDAATTLAGITDRDIYEQVEILNQDYGGKKADYYNKVVPPEILARVGRIPIRFVLARRTPSGALTSGIERRVNATPLHVQIKSFATGGLDAWDTAHYLNVWAGTFSGADDGLLGISTFPFTTTEGPHGVVIGISTLPYTSPTARGYYPQYSEGSTLSHEIGHYFYLFHTFGDQSTCNNLDFRLQSGWPLPNGAGPEGDDTPAEKAAGNAYFGNPSMNYSDGCATEPFGEMYGSYMNYFDDRALFMFSDGMRKRVVGCIDAYRFGLKTSNGATPPSAVTDAYLVTTSPRGIIERRAYITNNMPLTATVRNSGTSALTSITINLSIDGGAATSTVYPLNLVAGNDTVINVSTLNAAAGNHTLLVYTSAPNTGVDNFTNNDTLRSYINVSTATIAAPFTETFSSATFPSAGWQIWNPNANTTWTRSTTSGYTTAGAATVNNYNYSGVGQLDELITPPITFGANDSSVLSFRVAHAVYDVVDVSQWDGLEVYVSGDNGLNYDLVYKKTGNFLKTIAAAQATSFTATPAQPDRWRLEQINLSPYIKSGKQLIVKFRNTTAFGNNTFLDDIAVTASVKPQIELQALSLLGVPDFSCATSLTPSLVAKNNGSGTINTYKVTYSLDNATPTVINVTTPLTGGQTATIPLGSLPLTTGTHVFTVIANSPNGAPDPVPGNDTIRKTFVIFPTVGTPLVENFEGAFPPNGWAVNNPDGATTWSKTTLASRKVKASDSASAFVRNFTYTSTGSRDELYTPKINVANVDSVFLQFDVAASNFNYPGATAIGEDTLEVLVSKDCGATFQSVYKKWGIDLQTLGAPNDPNSSEYYPLTNLGWRRDSVNLLPYVGGSSTFQVIFRNTHNAPGNNVFIDNVNVYSQVLPSTLKQQGYLVLPTVFNSQFGIWHYTPPTTLRAINVYNSSGQLVFARQFNGNADTFISVNLSNKAAGMYFVNLRYADSNRNVTQKVIKY